MQIDFSQYQFLDQPPFFIGVDRDATDFYSEYTRKHLSPAPHVEYALRRYHSGHKVIDLGANIGHFTLPLANQGVAVLAVEALPANFVALCQSIAKNHFANTTPVHAAVFDSPGIVWMSGFSAWGQISHGIDRAPVPDFKFDYLAGLPVVRPLSTEAIPVPAMTLDDLCGTYNFWDASLVKMDIEGAELAAFRGANEFMRRNKDAVFLFEANELASLEFNYPVSDLLSYLEAQGYNLFMFHGNNLVPRTSQSYQEVVCVDYLATRSTAPPLAEGFVSRPLLLEERINMILNLVAGTNHRPRAYTLGMAATLPKDISSDSRIQNAIRQINLDLPDELRPHVARISEAAQCRGVKT